MNIKKRIKNDVINLTDDEKNQHYHGAGWMLARFSDGLLTGFFDPLDMPYRDDLDNAIKAALEAAKAYIVAAEADAEQVWLVMCSCGELVKPRLVSANNPDAAVWAAMAARFGDALSEHSWE